MESIRSKCHPNPALMGSFHREGTLTSHSYWSYSPCHMMTRPPLLCQPAVVVDAYSRVLHFCVNMFFSAAHAGVRMCTSFVHVRTCTFESICQLFYALHGASWKSYCNCAPPCPFTSTAVTWFTLSSIIPFNTLMTVPYQQALQPVHMWSQTEQLPT